jgi:protein-S-isoprenylcysteine O-methyltransferase Ste14
MRPGIPPLLLTGLVGLAMWIVARILRPLAFDLPFAGTLAALLGAAGLAICVLGVLPFRRAGTTVDPTRPERASALVTTGIYRATRNPMYVGMLLVLVAWGAFLLNAAALLLGPAAFALYLNRRQIPAEERALAAAFGQAYADYARRVRRWI